MKRIFLYFSFMAGMSLMTSCSYAPLSSKSTPLYNSPFLYLYPKGPRPASCAPIPADYLPKPTPAGTATPTPNLQTLESLQAHSTYIPLPTLTPIPFARKVDFDPSVPSEDKSTAIVFRCDGTFELWLLTKPEQIDQVLSSLNPGDLIITYEPPLSMKNVPHPPTIT